MLLYIAWLILPRWISIPFLVLYFVNMAISKAPESGEACRPISGDKALNVMGKSRCRWR